MTKLQANVTNAWSHLLRACRKMKSFSSDPLQEALDASEDVERKHRRFTGGTYRLSVADTAKMFVLLYAYEGSPPPKSWIEAADKRRDVVLAYALHERLRHGALFDTAFPEPRSFMSIDYARDVAK